MIPIRSYTNAQDKLKLRRRYPLVVFLCILGMIGCSGTQKPKDTLATPEDVLQETIAVFTLIAKHINTGKKELRYLHEFDQAKTKMIK